MVTYENLHDTLSFYSIDCRQSYYISSGKPIFEFPKAPFRMDYYALCICTAGEINIEIDRQKYKVDAHSFLMAAPSTIVKFGKTSDDFIMKLLFFDKNFLIKNISNPFIIEKMNLFSKGSYSVVKTTSKNSSLLQNLLDDLEKNQRSRVNLQKRLSGPLFFTCCWKRLRSWNRKILQLREKRMEKKTFI
ncbi:hypothetical protein [Chryseobacterium sp. R2ACT005]|uniref:hypothetical protein n=1 Tax=Chryseobacterium sp. R2ACT005 TaxID=3416668 RepID=UPI003CF81549